MSSTPGNRSTLAEALASGPLGERKFLGATCGPYRVESVIARGGMGMVFRALHQQTGQVVALKVLLAGTRATDTQRKRFHREAALASQLRHAGIVPVLDFGEVQGSPWMALEFVEGTTLADVLHEQPLRPFVRTMARTARAVGHAHTQGVVHRDLKPRNILIRGRDGKPLVTDFGIARDLTLASSLTKTGASLGTPLYMAPEQGAGETATPATDVYALGTILYEGLTGEPPFDPSEGVVPLYNAIANQPPRPPSKLNANVPAALERVCLKALAKSPGRRQANGDELADELEAWLEGMLDAPSRRTPLLLVLGAVLLVLGIGVGLTAWGSGAEPTAEEPRAAPDPDPAATAKTPAAPTDTGTDATRPAPTAPTAGPRRVVLQPGPVGGQDTYVRNDGLYWNDNQGGDPVLVVGDRLKQRGDFRGFIRFDLKPIPAQARLRQATLELYVASTTDLRKAIRVEVHPVVASSGGRTPWREGTNGKDRCVDGMVWHGDHPRGRFPVSRSRRPQFTQPDVDRDRCLARFIVQQGQKGWISLEVTDQVRRWLRDRRTNHGLRLGHTPEGSPWDDGRFAFASSDHRRSALWPKLTLEYEGPPPAEALDPEQRMTFARARATKHLLSVREEGYRPTERAIQSAQRAVELAPFWGHPYFVRGFLRLKQYPDDVGLHDLLFADRARDPHKSEELYLARGETLLRFGHIQRALRDAKSAVAIAGNPRGYALSARCLTTLKRFNEARSWLQSGLKKHPGDAQLKTLLARLPR